jgi:glycosyltransferase involved in cell wall biosynthesis
MNNKTLAILHVSPPVHGAAAIGDFIVDSESIASRLGLFVIPIVSARNIEEIGSFKFRKFFSAISMTVKVLTSLCWNRPKTIYYTASSSGVGLYRDLVVTFPIKIYTCLSKSKLYLHYHTKGISDFIGSSKLKYFLVKWLLWNSRVIVLSPSLKIEYLSLIPEQQIYCLPNLADDPFDNNDFQIHIDQKFSKCRESVNFLYVSNMIKSKGYQYLLELAVLCRGKPFAFNFAGAWQSKQDERDFFKFIDDNKLSHSVNYHGLVRGEQKNKLFIEADIFLLPTRYPKEAFPLSVLEALSYGLPTICTNEGALPSIIDDSVGRIVEDVQEFGDVVTSCYKELLSKHVSARCRDRYEERYTAKIYEESFITILSE